MTCPFRVGDEVRVIYSKRSLCPYYYREGKRVVKVWDYCAGLNHSPRWVLDFNNYGQGDSRWAKDFELAAPPTIFQIDLRAYLEEELK